MFTTCNDPLSLWRLAMGGWAKLGWRWSGLADALACRRASMSHAKLEEVWLAQDGQAMAAGCLWAGLAGRIGLVTAKRTSVISQACFCPKVA